MPISSALSPRVLCVGVATHDAIALVPRFPGPDERLVAQAVVHAGGGPTATAAVACTRLGVPAAFVGAVGEDALGEAVLAGLRAEGVDVSAVLRVPGRTGSSVVVVDQGRGSRAICNQPGPVLSVPPGSPAARLIAAAEWVHVDQAGWGAARDLVRGRLSVDAGNPIPGLSPRGVALFAPTMERLVDMFGPDVAPPALLRAALAAGAGCVVATNGAYGCLAAAGAEAWSVPALPGPVLSTLGAGDVFHGALLAAGVHGLDLPLRAAYANIAAALSCRGLDGRSAIPSHDEVMALLPSLHTIRLELP